jgi:hypothetical protein
LKRSLFVILPTLLIATLALAVLVRLSAGHDAPSTPVSNKGADVPTSPDKRIPHAPPVPGEVRSLTIKQLGNFEYAPDGGSIPADVQRLNGMTVRLQGYMIPQLETQTVTHFMLVPSLFNCCFGKPPTLQHTVVVDCPNRIPASYSSDEVLIIGKLDVAEIRSDGYVVSLFHVSCDSVYSIKHGRVDVK